MFYFWPLIGTFKGYYLKLNGPKVMNDKANRPKISWTGTMPIALPFRHRPVTTLAAQFACRAASPRAVTEAHCCPHPPPVPAAWLFSGPFRWPSWSGGGGGTAEFPSFPCFSLTSLPAPPLSPALPLERTSVNYLPFAPTSMKDDDPGHR